MIRRIVDVSEAAFLHLQNGQLLIDKEGKTVGRIPIEDLGVLILQHPAIVLTQKAAVACQKNNAIVVFCDERHLPYSALLPIAEGNTLHNKILRQQIALGEATRKRLWQNIVRQKIEQQAATLAALGKPDAQLRALAGRVKSGDAGNFEAHAAQVYWKLLFGDAFVRDAGAGGVNAALNYGYAVMRAMVARSLCGAGLHPSLGLFHHNQYNALCLADDLMEPFRAWVDYRVYRLHQLTLPRGELMIDRETKRELLGLLSANVFYDKRKMPLMTASHYLTADLKRCYGKEKQNLNYPLLADRE